MKLNLNFSLYKGTTNLKEWWKAVKSHFEAVQTAHNALEDEVAAAKTQLSTEINQRTTADLALANRIASEETTRKNADIALSDRINNEEDERTDADALINQRIDYLAQNSSRVRNCLLDIENYEDGNLLTDSKGNKYLSDIFSFDDSYYKGMHIEVSTFAKTPLYPSKLLFEIEVAGQHYSADNCDSFSILNPDESYIRITYSDNTEESISLGYGKSEISVTNEPPTADIAENYTCYKIKMLIECTKQIKSLVFGLEGDNYLNYNDNPSGDSCILELIVKKLACYDEECIAVFGDIMKLSKQMDEESAERRTADENIKGNISSLDLAMASMNSLLGTLSDELDAVNGAEG